MRLTDLLARGCELRPLDCHLELLTYDDQGRPLASNAWGAIIEGYLGQTIPAGEAWRWQYHTLHSLFNIIDAPCLPYPAGYVLNDGLAYIEEVLGPVAGWLGWGKKDVLAYLLEQGL